MLFNYNFTNNNFYFAHKKNLMRKLNYFHKNKNYFCINIQRG